MPEWITKYWVEWVFGLLIAGLGWVVKTLSKRLKVQQAENKALRDGMKSLLRVQIEKECERCQRDKWCGAVKRSSIIDMYTSYKALGGNGGVTSMVDQTLALPSVEPEKGEKDHD